MFYLLLGLAMGTFVAGLIAKIYTHESNWIPAKYLFGLSLLFLLIALFISGEGL